MFATVTRRCTQAGAIMETTAVAASNVFDLQARRQRRIARRMAMQAIMLQLAYPCLFRYITPYSTLPATRCT